MKIVVLKFGGTSVGTIQKIKKVAEIIEKFRKKKYHVIVVSSAMSGVTNKLIKKSREISENFSTSEYDGQICMCVLMSMNFLWIYESSCGFRPTGMTACHPLMSARC